MRYKGLYDSHSFDSLFDTLMVKAADQAQSNTDLLFSSGVFDPFAAALPFFVTPPAWENTTKDLSSVPFRAAAAPASESAALSTVGFSAQGAPDGATAPANLSALKAPAQNELLVQFSPNATADEKAAAISSVGGKVLQTVRADSEHGDLILINASRGQTPDALVSALEKNPHVSFAETNWSLSAQAVANDTYYANGSMWGMYGDATSPSNSFGSQAGEAWAGGYTGSTTVVVGVIDSGVDYTHPDLYQNIWLNQGELPKIMALVDVDGDALITFRDLNDANNAAFVSDLNLNGRIDAGDLLQDARWENGVDGDRNGYVDDLIGWDFVNNDNDPYDGYGHGTHVSGTIGATGGNDAGVAGVAWNVQIMSLKVLSDSGSGSVSSAVMAMDYYTAASIADNRTDGAAQFIATSNSWGGGGYSIAMQDSILRGARQDVLFVAAAGNGGADNDASAYYPSNYSTLSGAGYEAVIAVGALSSNGELASYSNFGATTVDLAAPGTGIWSTVPGGGYASYSGTSMATPHVSGALALYAAAHPDLNAAQLREVLLASAAPTVSLTGKMATGGRVDADVMFDIVPSTTSTATGVSAYGVKASDTVLGTHYADIISGVPVDGKSLGKGTVDTLVGLGDNDVFIFGDARGHFYDDGMRASAGTTDYGIIEDWSSGDRIQLSRGNYFFTDTSVNGVTGAGIYHDSNKSGQLDARDELIGIVQNVAASSLHASDLLFV